MPLETPARIVRELAARGYNAEREAVTLLAGAADPAAALDRAVDTAPPDALRITAAHVRTALDAPVNPPASDGDGARATGEEDPHVSTGDRDTAASPTAETAPVETEGSAATGGRVGTRDTAHRSVEIAGDITGRSTGTGEYKDFVAVFRDRYEKLSGQLRGRVNHRPAEAIQAKAAAAHAQALVSGSEALIAHLKLEIEKLRRELYGQRSERKQRLLDQLELQLEEMEATASEDEALAEAAAEKAKTTVGPFQRRKPVRKPFPEHLPRERVVVGFDEPDLRFRAKPENLIE